MDSTPDGIAGFRNVRRRILFRSAGGRRVLPMAENSLSTARVAILVFDPAELERIAHRLCGIEEVLHRLVHKEEVMAVEQSQEAQALDAALAELDSKVTALEGVDHQAVADLEALPAILRSFNPVSVAQVNAVTAAAERVAAVSLALSDADVPAHEAEAGATPPAPPAEEPTPPAPPAEEPAAPEAPQP